MTKEEKVLKILEAINKSKTKLRAAQIQKAIGNKITRQELDELLKELETEKHILPNNYREEKPHIIIGKEYAITLKGLDYLELLRSRSVNQAKNKARMHHIYTLLGLLATIISAIIAILMYFNIKII